MLWSNIERTKLRKPEPNRRCTTLFTFPEDARWNAERQVVELGVEIGEYQGVVRVPRRVFQRLLTEGPTPERCVEAFYLQRTRSESIAERKLRRRQLTEDGNVEFTGRDLREGSSAATRSAPMWRWRSTLARGGAFMARDTPNIAVERTMFTTDILFGMSILSLAGFAVMGLSLTLRRMAQASAPLCIGLMCVGTALVFLGLYAGGRSN
jgi:hypothetical protein